jgi:hypothetical protein
LVERLATHEIHRCLNGHTHLVGSPPRLAPTQTRVEIGYHHRGRKTA